VCSRQGMAGMETALSRLSPQSERPHVALGILNRHFDAMEADGLRFIAPPTAFELTAETAHDLAVGDLICAVLLHVPALERRLQQEGLISVWQRDRLRVQDASGRGIVIGGLMDRVTYGLLSTDCFVQILGEVVRTVGAVE
jgi:hypothetical protein